MNATIEGEAFDRLTESLSLFSHAVATAFTPIAGEAEKTFSAFGDAWLLMAEQSYLLYHRRLPGSLRTSRLRKKRRTKVLMWFERYIGLRAGEPHGR